MFGGTRCNTLTCQGISKVYAQMLKQEKRNSMYLDRHRSNLALTNNMTLKDQYCLTVLTFRYIYSQISLLKC